MDDSQVVNGVVGLVFLAVELCFILIMLISLWKVNKKADQPGWAILIPIYNIIVLLRIAGRPTWWILLFLIPFVNIIVSLTLSIDIARSFGKGLGFGLGIIFLPFIFYPILAFGDSEYQLSS